MKNPKDQKKRRPKHASLIKKYNPRIRQEYIDQDYLDKLNPEELEWLSKFMGEWNGASFAKDGSDIDQTEDGYKAANDRNNARNRDIYGILKNKADKVGTNRRLVNFDALIPEVEQAMARDVNTNSIEDAYVEFLEGKELEVMLNEYDAAMASYREPLLEVLKEAEYCAEDSDNPAQNL